MSFKIGVLASTSGTDLQAIIDEMKAGRMPGIELACVISNKRDAYALTRAKEQGYKTYFVKSRKRTREEFDAKVAELLEKHKVDLVVLIGYMKIITPVLLDKFKEKIINVHPALIPKYSGKDFFGKGVHEAVLANKEKETGMTIHYVDSGVDTGPIILQKTCPVYAEDTVEDLKDRVQALEKEWYPEVIRQLAKR